MTRSALLGMVPAILLAGGADARAQSVDLSEHLEFRVEKSDGTAGELLAGRLADVGIDATVRVEWDEESLATAIGRAQSEFAVDEALLGRIEFLRRIATGFHEVQGLLVGTKRAGIDVARHRRDGAPEFEVEAARERFFELNDAFATRADSLLGLLQQAEDQMETPEGRALARQLLARANEAILTEKRYDSLATLVGHFATVETDRLHTRLRQRLSESRVQVFMEAWIGLAGARRRLHLPGYDSVATGPPRPYPRFQLSPDERLERELAAAEQLGQDLQSPDSVAARVARAFEALKEAGRAVTAGLEDELLQASLDTVRRSLDALAEEEVRALSDEMNRTRSLLRSLRRGPQVGAASDAATLLRLAEQFGAASRELRRLVRDAGDRFERLADNLAERAAELEDAAQSAVFERVAERLRRAHEMLTDDPAVRQVLDDLASLEASLGVTGEVVRSGERIEGIGRAAGPARSLDASLELLTAGERHPGNVVVFRAQVVRKAGDNGGEIVVGETRRMIRLRVLGFYLEPRGALLLADPREAELEAQSYEPAVSLAYVAHLGLRNATAWNALLNPGLGLSLSLMDFVDDRDFELGVGAVATLLRDFLYAGYGRNLQAGADYFFVGLNPLAVDDLWSQQRGAAALGGG